MNETNDPKVDAPEKADERLQISRRTLLKTSAVVGGGVARILNLTPRRVEDSAVGELDPGVTHGSSGTPRGSL